MVPVMDVFIEAFKKIEKELSTEDILIQYGHTEQILDYLGNLQTRTASQEEEYKCQIRYYNALNNLLAQRNALPVA
jgi:hypothetical protein